MSEKKLGFALGSGGSRGVAHIGFLQAMEENGIRPDYITGCSMGSVIGAVYASGMKPLEIYEVVRKLKPFDILEPSVRRGGLFNTRKMRKIIAEYVGEKDFSELEIPFHCVAVDLNSQQLIEFSEGNVVDAVVASSSIPAVFKPTQKDDMLLVDGGILERVPVLQLSNMGAEKIVAVDVLGRLTCKKRESTLGILLGMIDLMDNFRTQKRREENKKLIDLWIEPNLETMSQYSFNQMEFAYKRGYEAGLAHVEEIKELVK